MSVDRVEAENDEATGLSFNGKKYLASNKKYSEVVVIVPFYGAKRNNLLRHINWLNDIGYDVVAFDLKFKPKSIKDSVITAEFEFGFKHVWADQIGIILNEVFGPKIVFAFSNPSSAAIEAIAERHASDVKALVCDSGPSGELWNSIHNYYKHEIPIRIPILRQLATTLATTVTSLNFLKEVKSDLEKFPKGFEILSVRGWKDPLISPNQIDKIFNHPQHLNVQRLSLPRAKHLDGLKNHFEEYSSAVTAFLERHSTKVTGPF